MTPAVRFLDRRTPPHIMTLVLACGIGALSMNIFLPSLPQMADDFGVDYSVMQLSVSLYIAMIALLQILIGPISDSYGRRPVMLAATALFVLATLGAILAPTFGVFLACRLTQAVIATSFALSRAVVRDMVGPDQAAGMIGWVTMGMSVVPMVSPMLGGFLGMAFGWRAGFVVMVLSGMLLFAVLWADQGETRRGPGSTLRQQARDYPELLRSQRFWGYSLAAGLGSGAFFAFMGGAPLVGAQVFHLDPATLGLYFGAPAVGYLVGNGLSGRYAARLGIARMVMIGALTSVGGMVVMLAVTLAGFGSAEVFFGLTVFVGLGNGLLLPSANAGMLLVRPHLVGSAAGLGGACMTGFGAALAAVAGVVLGWGGGEMPLILVMLATSAGTLPCLLWVRRRERQIGGAA